ncbi:MAG: hypothetical protein ACI30H_00970 [Paludibacteraceae bacterium]
MGKYNIDEKCYLNIVTFYNNVAKKYCNTYSFELMIENILDAYDSIYRIENGLCRRNPTIERWQNKGCYMANTKKWYFLYKIEGDTIVVVDACHSQNMHESWHVSKTRLLKLISESIMKHIFGV